MSGDGRVAADNRLVVKHSCQLLYRAWPC